MGTPLALRHGQARRKRHTREYRAWERMHARCRRHPHYVRGGIQVCARWSSFIAFYEDMGSCPLGGTLDRQDGTLGYFKDNCRWASWEEQARNQRGRKPITAFRQTKLLVEWAAITGVSVARMWARLYVEEWPVERALTEPPRRASTVCKKGHEKPSAQPCPECKRVRERARYHSLRVSEEGTGEEMEFELP